jgi:hypothetical protein
MLGMVGRVDDAFVTVATITTIGPAGAGQIVTPARLRAAALTSNCNTAPVE